VAVIVVRKAVGILIQMRVAVQNQIAGGLPGQVLDGVKK